MSKRFEFVIEVSADGRIWQAVHPAEVAPSEGRNMHDFAQVVARNQNVVEPGVPGDRWRVRVRRVEDSRRGLDLYGDDDVVTHHLNGEGFGSVF